MQRIIRTAIAGAACAAIAAFLWIGPSSVQAAAVGGPFQLVDHSGQTVTEESFDDRYLLVYFGYAYCPDICPTELLIMGQAVDELDDLSNEVQPLFITVDPARDTVAALAEYVPAFHPRLVGLTGSDEQIHDAAKAYRIYYRLNEPDENGAYLVDHTSIHLFHGPGRRLLDPLRLRPGAGEDGRGHAQAPGLSRQS